MMQKLVPQLLLSIFFSLFIICKANQAHYLQKLIRSRGSQSSDTWLQQHTKQDSVFISPQHGQMQADKIDKLPGQPDNVDFNQYSGYVTVDPQNGRALFYYFVESPTNSSTNPLVLWLNGGPGCSSLGAGAMEELGPFRVNSDGKTLFRNKYAWNNVANVIFLESPVTVGFSYSNTSSDYYNTGDTTTAIDSYTFLVNWLERFPQYKTRDFYITGESYAGRYVPELAYTILLNNQNTSRQSVINLKGVAVGNSYMDDPTFGPGLYDYLWMHALNSDETHAGISTYCDFNNETLSDQCYLFESQSYYEIGNIEINNIYAPVCLMALKSGNKKKGPGGSIDFFDPCSFTYVDHYLNSAKVQRALHVKPAIWNFCRLYNWTDSPSTVLPIFENLIDSGIRVWLYSGDVDSNVPVTTTRYAINSLKIPVETAWRPWYLNNEVGGYVEGYKGLTLVTVRGAGHEVPSYQPERALTMISSFLQGILPPSS